MMCRKLGKRGSRVLGESILGTPAFENNRIFLNGFIPIIGSSQNHRLLAFGGTHFDFIRAPSSEEM